ncbi:hypothetical protein [Sporolactobacillus terrae]|uniref:hypothetical protein n=1 Tax=Sporolactobacillus terrae TaxID=269673 RepID=UPI001CBBD688|nr:hypothetical protein [Sporolactobacillus terrae]UAK17555.1 hypothetical protein K7399_06410 [Sporolactobacillus terrae]
MADTTKIPFGPATVTVGEGEDAIVFDGQEYMQAEGGQVQLTPQWSDITAIDFGSSPLDRRLTGYQGQVQITAAQEDMKILDLALAASEPITDTTTSTVVGLTDSKIGTSLRAKGKKIVIHPRNLDATDKSLDIVIYKAASDGQFTKQWNQGQTNRQITLAMMPRDGFDPTKDGNYFYIGPTDPNAAP